MEVGASRTAPPESRLIASKENLVDNNHPVIDLGSAAINLTDTITSILAQWTYLLHAWGSA
ncbi:hypothetical protein JMUB6875_76300 [Nocardia sp. JMUB6875]